MHEFILNRQWFLIRRNFQWNNVWLFLLKNETYSVVLFELWCKQTYLILSIKNFKQERLWTFFENSFLIKSGCKQVFLDKGYLFVCINDKLFLACFALTSFFSIANIADKTIEKLHQCLLFRASSGTALWKRKHVPSSVLRANAFSSWIKF